MTKTPMIYWRNIKTILPKDIIYYNCYDSNHKQFQDLGLKVNPSYNDYLSCNRDLPEDTLFMDMPPVNLIDKICYQLATNNHKFCLLIPIAKLSSPRTQKYFKTMDIQVVIPNHYTGFKTENGKVQTCPNQYQCYVTRGLDLPSDLHFLEGLNVRKGRPRKCCDEMKENFCMLCRVNVENCECAEPKLNVGNVFNS